mgnify:CR=1 FL=1
MNSINTLPRQFTVCDNSKYSDSDSEKEPLLHNVIHKDTQLKIKKIKILLTILLLLCLFTFIVSIINLIEYNIVLHNFNGFSGIQKFINKTSIVVNELDTILNHINQTETKIYVDKFLVLIDKACSVINCTHNHNSNLSHTNIF